MTDEPASDEPASAEPITDLTLAEILATAAEDLSGVTAGTDGPTTTWSAAGRPFATLVGEWAEFRLDPMVARAALRTPDAATSSRGPDWVAFAPTVLDDPAIDRAEAWFLSAHRHATVARN